MLFIWKGLILGFSIAAPVGPIGVLCIKRSLAHGPKYGFLTGMGAATADTFYGMVAALGIASVSALIEQHQRWLHWGGGVFLLVFGWKVFTSKPAHYAPGQDTGALWAAYLSSLALTLTNPLTILSFIGAFAGLGLGVGSTWGQGFWLIAGVFMGSSLWWLLLSCGMGLLKRKVNDNHLSWINRVCGGAIMVFGLGALVT